MLALELPRLRNGDSGAAVRLLQKILIRLGQNIPFDAQFGAKTEMAVKNFQKSKNITPDGIAGSITWGKLTDAL